MDLSKTLQALQKIAEGLAKARTENKSLAESMDKVISKYGKADGVVSNVLKNLSMPQKDGVKEIKKLIEQQVSAASHLAAATARWQDKQIDFTNTASVGQKKDLADLTNLWKLYNDSLASGDVNAASAAAISLGSSLGKVKTATKEVFDAFLRANRAEENVKQLTEEINKANKELKITGNSFKSIESMVVDLLHHMQDDLTKVNKALLDTNAGIFSRIQLLSTSYKAAAETGAQFEDVLAAQVALVDSGQKWLAYNTEAVKAVTLISGSLGVSAESAAELTRWTGLTKGNIDDAATAALVLLERTRLTGKESVSIATQMAKVAFEFGQISTNLGGVTVAAGAVQDSVRELGGSADSVVKILDRFSHIEGIGDAQLFGGFSGFAIDPAALSDANKLQEILLHVGQTVNNMTGGGKSPLMFAAMEPMFQRLGMSLADARAFSKLASDPTALKNRTAELQKYYENQNHATALQARFNKQLAQAGGIFSQLESRLETLLKMALTPFLTVLIGLATVVNTVLGWIIKLADTIGQFGVGVVDVGNIVKLVATVIAADVLWMGASKFLTVLARLPSAMSLAVAAMIYFETAMAGLKANAIGGAVIGAAARAAPVITGIGAALAGIGTTIVAGLATALEVTLGVIFSPIGLAVAAIAAVVFGAFKFFQWYKHRAEQKDSENREIQVKKVIDATSLQDIKSFHKYDSDSNPLSGRYSYRVQSVRPLPGQGPVAAIPSYEQPTSAGKITAADATSGLNGQVLEALARINGSVAKLNETSASGSKDQQKTSHAVSDKEASASRARWLQDATRTAAPPTFMPQPA